MPAEKVYSPSRMEHTFGDNDLSLGQGDDKIKDDKPPEFAVDNDSLVIQKSVGGQDEAGVLP